MRAHYVVGGAAVVAVAFVYLASFSDAFATVYDSAQKAGQAVAEVVAPDPPWPAVLNKDEYNKRVLALAHLNWASTTPDAARAAATTSPRLLLRTITASSSIAIAGKLWPHPATYPEGGAILPFKRIVAYYGNFYSRQMGVLGEYPREQVMAKLASTTAAWAAADPATPTIPAIQYIAVVAQGSATGNGKWIARMPDDQVDKALEMANEMHGLLFLDVQVGQSTVQKEVPMLEKYLQMPNVMLAIDPEFSMKHGEAPGTVIGTFDASDINWAANYLAGLVQQYHLPPKVLVVHRFTYDMITNAARIAPLPEVQLVIDMDGWGSQAKKIGTYTHIVAPEPVQFTGLKLFYHADLKPPSTGMLTMGQVLSLTPAPIYIQYQ